LAARLHALAVSHELLVKHDWQSIDFEKLLTEQLSGLSDRIHWDGPQIQIPANSATSMGLVLHELATNATKYGALSNSTGHIDLKWQKLHKDGKQQFQLVWAESGGPAVSEPEREGFGSQLIQKALANADVRRDFRPSGLVCTIEFPLE
jgi:two-component system CheB/CheR fusion protein